MNNYIFTFMQRSSLKDSFVRIEANTPNEARQKMHDAYGDKWAFMYNNEDDAGVGMFNLREVELGTPQELEGP